MTNVKTMAETMESPPHPASVWTENGWERVVATIMDTGHLRLNPPEICPRCTLVFTESEWAAFPKPAHHAFVWDFKTEAWIDRRDASKLKTDAMMRIRNIFEAVRWRTWGSFIEAFEVATWQMQVEEAILFLRSSDEPTPGIDAYLAELSLKPTTVAGCIPPSSEGAAPTLRPPTSDADNKWTNDKTEFCQGIIKNNVAFKVEMMRVNGRQKNWLNQLADCADNAAVDALMAEIEAFDCKQREAG